MVGGMNLTFMLQPSVEFRSGIADRNRNKKQSDVVKPSVCQVIKKWKRFTIIEMLKEPSKHFHLSLTNVFHRLMGGK